MPTNKLTTLAHLQSGLQSAKTYIDQQDAILSGQIAEIVADIEGIVSTGGEANILEGVKVNGTALTIADKMVDILIEAGEENGTISVNGAAVAVTGLAALAYKSEITEDELSDALKASIAAKATQADLDALAVRVESVESAGYQTAEQVQAIAMAAVAASGHAHFEKVDAVPAVDTAEENVLYLVMNSDTGHYDIYALVGGAVERIDDTTVDLSNYSTTEQMTAAINAAIADKAALADLTAAVERITAVEAKFNDYYTSAQMDAKLAEKMNVADMDAYATDAEAQSVAESAAAAALAANTATDAEVSTMLNEVFGN